MVIAGAGLPNLPALLIDVKTYSERLFCAVGSLIRKVVPHPAPQQEQRPDT